MSSTNQRRHHTCENPETLIMDAADLRTHYRKSEQVRGAFDQDQERGLAYFNRYVRFTLAHVPCAGALILDIGCGSGWSTVAFRNAGHLAFGVDLHSNPEARAVDEAFPFVSADATALPFRDSSVDLIGMHQVLEHFANPEQALREALRVLKPKGRLVVVGPNLLSVGLSVRSAATESWKAIQNGGRWEARTPEMPRHPFGNTLPEVYQHLFRHAWNTARKLLGERPVKFLTRVPDVRPPAHADNDASYFCNPMDLLLWAKQTRQAKAIRWWGDRGRLNRLCWPVWGGTWVVLEKQ
jgi:SAM-dependent methyltransferase